MTYKNMEVRLLIKENDLTMIDVAKQMGVSRGWLSNLMRYDLNEKNRTRILNAIEELKHNKGELKACPFCGENDAFIYAIKKEKKLISYGIMCPICELSLLGASSDGEKVDYEPITSTQEIIDIWNRRR